MVIFKCLSLKPASALLKKKNDGGGGASKISIQMFLADFAYIHQYIDAQSHLLLCLCLSVSVCLSVCLSLSLRLSLSLPLPLSLDYIMIERLLLHCLTVSCV